jgi:hypothetical protein
MHEELRRYRLALPRACPPILHALAPPCVRGLVLWTHSWQAAAAAESRVTGTVTAGNRRLLTAAPTQARGARLWDRLACVRHSCVCDTPRWCLCCQVAGTYLVCGAGDSYMPDPH